MNHLEPGDRVVCKKGLFEHVGVVLHGGFVLHNTPERGEHITTLFDFCQGQSYRLIRTPTALRQIVLANASRIVANPRHYDALTNNCEHTVTRAFGQKPYSPQLVGVLALIVGAGFLYFALRAK